MLTESIQHQIGCKRFNYRLRCLISLYLGVGTLTLIAGVAETIIWSQPTIWSEFARRNLENLAILSPYAISPVIFLSFFFLIPPIVGYIVIGGYTQRVRLTLIIFMLMTAASLVASFILCILAIFTLSSIPDMLTLCYPGQPTFIPQIQLKSALPLSRRTPVEVNRSGFPAPDKTIECIDEANAGTQVTILSAIELVLSAIQLVISLVSLIIVTQLKPWKKFKVRVRTTYDRFRSLKLSCGCGGETKISKSDTFKESRVNHGFKVKLTRLH